MKYRSDKKQSINRKELKLVGNILFATLLVISTLIGYLVLDYFTLI